MDKSNWIPGSAGASHEDLLPKVKYEAGWVCLLRPEPLPRLLPSLCSVELSFLSSLSSLSDSLFLLFKEESELKKNNYSVSISNHFSQEYMNLAFQ